MKEWLERVEKSLDMAQAALERSGDIPRERMYMLAPLVYAQINHTNNDRLLDEMSKVNEAQFEQDCSHDEQSRYRYRFHYVSSFLYCYVVAGKIDEAKYDLIMDYVNGELDLFEDGCDSYQGE